MKRSIYMPPLPLRILHVHTDLLGGGIEKSLVTLATRTDAGEVAICWCPTNHPLPPQDFLNELQQRVKLFRIPPPFLSPCYPARLWRVIRRFRPAVLHLHGASVGIIGSAIGRIAKVPAIVYTEHSEHTRHAPWLQRAREVTASLPHHTVCVSDQIRSRLFRIKAFSRLGQRLSVIHNGIDLSQYRPSSADGKKAIRRELRIHDDALLVGSVGLLWYIKGYGYLLRAMPAIIDHTPQAQLVLIGSGEDEAKLKQLAEDLAIASQVHFLGWRNDIPRLLAALDVYVQPSLSEGLPMSILEAAATGLPIVATNVGGIPEIAKDGKHVILIAPRDEAALSEAIGDLLVDQAKREGLGAGVRHHVSRRFSANNMAEAYAELYRSLLPARYGGTCLTQNRR